jgi:hypothetical protein
MSYTGRRMRLSGPFRRAIRKRLRVISDLEYKPFNGRKRIR